MKFSKKIFLLFIVTLLTYLPSFWNQFVWDDEQFIYKNQYVLNFQVDKIFSQNTIAGAGQQSDYFRPLTTLSFAIDHAIWGLTPFGFHLTNTLLHIGAGIFLYLILTELRLSEKKNKLNSDLSFWISLIFLIHPIQTEAVVYMNSRGDSLFAFLGMTSLYLFTLIFRKEKLKALNLDINKFELAISSLFLYFGTILSKEIGIMVTGLFFLIFLVQLIKMHQFKWKKYMYFIKSQLSAFITTLASFAVAVFYMILRSTIWNFGDTYNLYHGQNEYTSSLLIRLLTFSKINFIYFKLLLFPYPLHMERDTALVKSLLTIWPWLLIALLIFLIAIGAYQIIKKHNPWILFGLIWFYIGLVPVSGIIPINGLLYEHWLYIPMIGFYIVIYQLIQLFIKIFKTKIHPKLILTLLILLTSIYSALTIRQNWFWRTPISFYNYQLQYSTSARMLNNLAMAYSEKAEHQKAIEYYQKAIDFSDIYPQTHYNLGNTYVQTGELEKAEQEFETTLQMSENFDYAYLPLINIKINNQQYDQALELTEKIATKYPNELQLQLIKLDLLIKLGKNEEAEQLADYLYQASNFNSSVKKAVEEILNPN